MEKVFETERLVLRPWEDSDAESLYEYAKDPDVGPAAGWPVHKSVEDSLQIIHDVLSAPMTYAVCLKKDGKAIGSIGLFQTKQKEVKEGAQELEVGYWIGVPFWGQGLIPEAVRELEKYAFEELSQTGLWCSYSEGNEKSRKCMEKCGFRYDHTEETEAYATEEAETVCYEHLTKEEWEEGRSSSPKK